MISAQHIYQTLVLFGPSGVGKSSLAATAPKPFFADSNQGLLSIANIKELAHVDKRDVHKFKDLDIIFDRFSGTGKINYAKKYNTLVFDHFDDIQSIILDELLELRQIKRGESPDLDQIEQREYGIMGNRLRRYVRKFKSLPVHKIFICGEKEMRNDGRLGPSLIGAMQNQLPYLCDHVAYLRLGSKGRRFLHFDPGEEFYAKTRAWWLTPEQRKIQIPAGDYTILTRIFETLASEPAKGTTKKVKKSTSTEKS